MPRSNRPVAWDIEQTSSMYMVSRHMWRDLMLVCDGVRACAQGWT